MTDLIPYTIIMERVKDDIDFIAEQAYERGKRDILELLQTAQPERKTGHWIPYDQRFPWSNNYKCSECGNYLNFSGVNGGRGDANYCPNCGADMRGGQDE